MEVVNFYVDHALQQLLVTVEADDIFNAAVESLTTVRVSNVPTYISIDAVVALLAPYGRVVYVQRGFHRLPGFPRAANGVLHVSMSLPGYLQFTDARNNLDATCPIHMDGGRRVCYRCGVANYVSQWCRAPEVLPSATESLWHKAVVDQSAATAAPPKPKPAAQAAPAAARPV
jgi:hypothetical protein